MSEIRLGPGQTLQVLEDGRERLVLESRWSAGAAPPMHWHPSQTEEFEVLEGVLTVELAGEPPRRHVAGDTFVVPPQTGHRMWSEHDGQTRARWTITPPQRTLEQLEHAARGRSLLRDLQLLVRFRNEFRIGAGPSARRDR